MLRKLKKKVLSIINHFLNKVEHEIIESKPFVVKFNRSKNLSKRDFDLISCRLHQEGINHALVMCHYVIDKNGIRKNIINSFLNDDSALEIDASPFYDCLAMKDPSSMVVSTIKDKIVEVFTEAAEENLNGTIEYFYVFKSRSGYINSKVDSVSFNRSEV